MPDIRAEVKEEIERMSDKDVQVLQEYPATFPNLFAAALRRVPYDEQPLSEELLRSLEEDELFVKNGGKGIPDEEVARELGLD